ncbi:uncharacterized protein LOC113791141 [Dermatophagoides pteronyssinus]|uniref:uncharacterized protein LOC113791141 n=1 Tax=Dermatophagoides pteronyssinus TaxID=6956 RepID=UPI003F677849
MCTKNCCVLIVLLFIIPLIFWNLSSYVNKKFYSCFSTRENLKYSSLKLLLLYHDKTTKTKEYYHLHLILNDTLYIFETEFRICEQTKSKTIHWCYIYLNKLISTEKWYDDTRYRIDGTKLSKINQLKLENVFKPNDQLLVYRFRINVTTSISVIRKRMKKYRYLINTNLPPMNCITDAYNPSTETLTTTTTTTQTTTTIPNDSSKKGYLIFHLNEEMIKKILEKKSKNIYVSTTDCPPGRRRNRRNRRSIGGGSKSRNRRSIGSNSKNRRRGRNIVRNRSFRGILELDCIFGEDDYNDYQDSGDDQQRESPTPSFTFNEKQQQLILVIDMISISFTKLIEQSPEENLFNRRPTSSKPDSIFIEWVIEIYTQMSKSIMELSEKDRDQDQDHDHDYDHDQDHDHDHDNDDHDHDHKINSTKFCSGHIPFGYVHRSFVHVWCVADYSILIFPYGQQEQMKKQEPDLSIKISIDHYIICPLQSYSSILLFLNEDYIWYILLIYFILISLCIACITGCCPYDYPPPPPPNHHHHEHHHKHQHKSPEQQNIDRKRFHLKRLKIIMNRISGDRQHFKGDKPKPHHDHHHNGDPHGDHHGDPHDRHREKQQQQHGDHHHHGQKNQKKQHKKHHHIHRKK